MQRHVAGPITARDLGTGAWHLAAPESVAVFLRGADGNAAECLAGPGILTVGLEWGSSDVAVTVKDARGVHDFKVASALIHQPRVDVYAALPLATFDAGAQRFWNRVFRLIRVPGGRFLLKFLARDARGDRAA